MNIRFSSRMTHILSSAVLLATIVALFHAPHFSFGLFIVACVYTCLVLIRDYVWRIQLDQRSGSITHRNDTDGLRMNIAIPLPVDVKGDDVK